MTGTTIVKLEEAVVILEAVQTTVADFPVLDVDGGLLTGFRLCTN